MPIMSAKLELDTAAVALRALGLVSSRDLDRDGPRFDPFGRDRRPCHGRQPIQLPPALSPGHCGSQSQFLGRSFGRSLRTDRQTGRKSAPKSL